MKPTGTDETKPAIVPIRRVKLYEEVAARIRDLIASGELRPGEALPSERKLAEQFKVGRAVIREAIRQLEVSGLIESRHGGATTSGRLRSSTLWPRAPAYSTAWPPFARSSWTRGFSSSRR